MKKSLLALAALTAFTGAAYAQSSVTLFGIVDLNARRVTNETAAGSRSLWTQSQDGIASSRLGFRGVEDIGGGLRAGFWLEGALNPDTGGTGQTWQRRSTVSLMGGFGEVRLGRDYTPDFWNHTVYDPFGTNGVGSSINTFSSLNGATTTVRANNTFGYFLPAMGGLFGQVQASLAEGPANGNKHIAGRIGYAAGPVSVAVAYGNTETANLQDWKRINVGGSFKFGGVTLMANYTTSDGGTGGELDHYMVGGNWMFGASTLKFSYTSSDGKGAISTRDASQIALGYQYDMSKRTAVYGTFARISNDGSATYVIGGGPAGQIAGKDSTGFEFGVRHTF